MDLSQLSTKELSDQGVVMTVINPKTGEELSSNGEVVTLTLAGIDSDRYRAHQRKLQNRRLKSLSRGRGAKLDLDADDLDEESLDTLVACTLDWSGIGWESDKDLPCTPENVKMVYQKLPWLRDQVDFFIGSRENFIQS